VSCHSPLVAKSLGGETLQKRGTSNFNDAFGILAGGHRELGSMLPVISIRATC
jgi:hypothetical protein